MAIVAVSTQRQQQDELELSMFKQHLTEHRVSEAAQIHMVDQLGIQNKADFLNYVPKASYEERWGVLNEPRREKIRPGEPNELAEIEFLDIQIARIRSAWSELREETYAARAAANAAHNFWRRRWRPSWRDRFGDARRCALARRHHPELACQVESLVQQYRFRTLPHPSGHDEQQELPWKLEDGTDRAADGQDEIAHSVKGERIQPRAIAMWPQGVLHGASQGRTDLYCSLPPLVGR